MKTRPFHSTNSDTAETVVNSAGDPALSRGRQPWRFPATVILVLFLTLSGAFLVPATAQEATPAAPKPLNHAGLVVEHGDGALTYVLLSFAEPELRSIEMLDRSGLEFATVPFGGLGDAICQVEGEGCDLTTCRRNVCQSGNSPFWQFLVLSESGTWDAVDLGASSFKVHDGDIVAWSWSNGPVEMPAVTIDEIAERVGVAPDQLRAPDAEPGAFVSSAGNRAADDDQNWTTLVAGVGALIVITGVGFMVVRRRGLSGGAQ